jgi:hypothetical protein
LAGHDAPDARAFAARAITDLGMEAIADLRLDKAALHGRRATVIAAAIATGAPAVMLEDPCAGLPDDVASSLGRLVVRALEGRDWIVFTPRVSRSAPLALAADEAVSIEGSQVTGQGAPAEIAAGANTYALTVHGSLDDLSRIVEARGARVVRGPSRLVVDLGDALTTRDLMAMALETRAVILEMSPLTHALE